jgi:hypothetical protein
MQQNAAWMEQMWGFRVSRHVSRYVFPVQASHPVVSGLDIQDLRDWAVQATRVRRTHADSDKTKKRLTAGTGAIAAAWLQRPLKGRTWPAGARFCTASSIWPIRP